LPVRMGLATGEAELRDGDYFGAVLNRAARVMAAGHGGQILLADSTAGLLSGVDLIDLGPRRLRDLPIPIGLFQVQAEDMRTDFPPLRALDVSPGNLRPATTSFIGRESEAGEVHAAVKAQRLVTLTGVGGVGKTRLALEVAGQLVDEFPYGVWFFELAAVTDPAAVPDAVAAVLGITQQPGKTVTESVAATLEGRVRLLVFDNCEHLLDAAADLIEANTGLVIAGTIGGGSHLEFTLIGDTVNVAARVEQLTKTTGDAILLTHQTVDALITRPPGLVDRGSHVLKGKSAPLQVFGLDQETDARVDLTS
jgi:class 3 adenylate cyclase